jgi:hypothetical protein
MIKRLANLLLLIIKEEDNTQKIIIIFIFFTVLTNNNNDVCDVVAVRRYGIFYFVSGRTVWRRTDVSIGVGVIVNRKKNIKK